MIVEFLGIATVLGISDWRGSINGQKGLDGLKSAMEGFRIGCIEMIGAFSRWFGFFSCKGVALHRKD